MNVAVPPSVTVTADGVATSVGPVAGVDDDRHFSVDALEPLALS